MTPTASLTTALWATVRYLDNDQSIPLRHVAVLLYILDRGEVISTDIQSAFKTPQAVVSRILADLRAKRLVESYQGTSKAHIHAPTKRGLKLKEELEGIILGATYEGP